jgi:hypothetical protein
VKKLILPICAILAIIAAVLVIVFYKPHSSPNATPQVASDFRANGGQSAQAGPSQAGGGPGQSAQTGGATEPGQPAGAPGESQQRTAPQTDTSNRSAPTVTSARQPQSGAGGPPQGDGSSDQERPAMRPGRFMERMDTNGDGKISKAEWKAHYDEMFAQADKNKNGYIDSDEMSTGFRPPGGTGPGGRRTGEGPGPGGPPGGTQ